MLFTILSLGGISFMANNVVKINWSNKVSFKIVNVIIAFDVRRTHSYTDWSRDCMGQR